MFGNDLQTTTLVIGMVFALIGCAFLIDFNNNGGGMVSEYLHHTGLRPAPKNSQGPWPECIWMTGLECAKFIRSQVPKNVEIEFMHKHAVNNMISEFNPNRVIIVVNDFDAVQEAPARGR